MAGELEGKKILLVDDDPDILASMEAAIDDMAPTILRASDGDTAIELADRESPDLVVLDMMLPKRGGLLVMEKLKAGKKRSDPPLVVMITGNRGVRHKSYAESLGVSAYLNKPFRMEKLVDTITGLLAAE